MEDSIKDKATELARCILPLLVKELGEQDLLIIYEALLLSLEALSSVLKISKEEFAIILKITLERYEMHIEKTR